MEKFFKEKIPKYIFQISSSLKEAGHSCYLVGGPVRDLLKGLVPDDFDLATDATPDKISEIFPKCVTTGAKFGTVVVLSEDSAGEHYSVEVTTFRSEADYIDGRWPSKVEFTTDLYKDLGRRDFTVNAMAINLQTIGDGFVDNDLVDLFGGKKDLDLGIIRAVGTPKERLLEDGLRAFRACRLASQLNFQVHVETLDAIRETTSVAKNISVERIRDEFMKMLMRSSKPSYGINLMKDVGLLELFLPELLEGIGVEQPSQYHVDDVYNHILATIDAAEDSVKLPALFHDIAKPQCADGEGHFYGHDVASSEMSQDILRRLRFSKSEIDRVARLVRWHMFTYVNWREGEASANWSDSAIRRLIKNVGGEEYINDLFKLRIADALGNPKSSFDPGEIRLLEARIAEVRAKDMVLTVKDLNVTGQDIMQLGVEKGPMVGKVLAQLLDEVIETPALNNKDSLLKLAAQYL